MDLPIKLDEAGCERSMSAKKQLHLVSRSASTLSAAALWQLRWLVEAQDMEMRDWAMIGQSKSRYFFFVSSRSVYRG